MIKHLYCPNCNRSTLRIKESRKGVFVCKCSSCGIKAKSKTSAADAHSKVLQEAAALKSRLDSDRIKDFFDMT